MEKQMNAEHIMKLLDIANNDLPLVESKYENFKRVTDSLTYEKISSEVRVSNLHKTIDQLQFTVQQLRHEEAKWNYQKEKKQC